MHRAYALIASIVLGMALFLQQGYLLKTGDQSADSTPVYTNVSRAAGILNNRTASEEMSIGMAWGDYNNDDWLDLYVTDPKGSNTLYRSNGDGTFTRSPLADQVALADSYSNGATFADYDNDGWKDLFVATWGVDHLFHNENGERFVNATLSAGIIDTGNTKSASWGDFDNDGFLDLYLANWSCYPNCARPMNGDSDRLFRNNGDGTFDDVSEYLGGSLYGAGFVASFNDFDNDGDPDIYLVNDEFINGAGNKLFRNDGAGCKGWCFTQIAKEAGANSLLFGMGLAVGDYDNDGDQDYFFTNVGPMELLQNQGNGTFRNVAKEAGVDTPKGIGWGSLFIDYNNDGWRDLYVAISDTTDHEGIASNKLYQNNKDGTFTLVDCNNEASDARPSLGAAYADYDRDGWVDLVVGNMDEGYRLYRNTTGATNNNHYLGFELIGAGKVNRDAVGAKITIRTSDGVTQMQEIINGSALGAGNELALYFGLGEEQKAQVTVRWSDGREQTFSDVAADRRYRLEYPLTQETSLQVINTSATRQTSSVIDLSFVIDQIAKAFSAIIPQSDDDRLGALMDQADVTPPTQPDPPSPELIKLGEALFWDPELSGNRDTSCATCHHPLKGTGDNLSVSIGTNGVGLGEGRIRLEERRDLIPRNAPPVFNLGYKEWKVLFWDGRAFVDPLSGKFDTPASDRLPKGLDNLLAAQAMFPVTSRDEMRGLRGDKDIFGQPNELAMIQDYTTKLVWSALMDRLMAIPAYVNLFQAAYPDVPAEQFNFGHAANAMSAYQSSVFTFEDSPYDLYIRGNLNALSDQQKRGAILFYGKAGCAECHSTGLLTDQKFHNIAVPQIGDGKGREQPFDFGRARETGSECDMFAFRTPPLRNVAITGPWMHNGAFVTLEATIRHHLNPEQSLKEYDPNQLTELMRDKCEDQPETLQAILATQDRSNTERIDLTDQEIDDLIAFLEALTSPSAIDLSHTIPASVPSGLPVGGNISNPSASLMP